MAIEEVTVKQIVCKYCQSAGVVRFGHYKNVQRYLCKSCGRKFKADNALFHMKTDPDIVSTAVTMYYTGSSLSDIRNYTKAHYDGYYPSKSVILGWVDKYTDIASKQFQDVHPNVGSRWVCDETVLKLDGGHNVWFWDCIDSDTRFLLASRASISRSTKDAQLLMDRAIKRAGKYPEEVVTDKLASYLDVNYGKGAEHIQGSPFRFKKTGESTADIERFRGTIKDRTKVIRSFRNLETLHTFINGFLTYYNFFKPHESLGGKTPAEYAGVEYDIRDWRDLVSLTPNHSVPSQEVYTWESSDVAVQTVKRKAKRRTGKRPSKTIIHTTLTSIR